MDVGFRCSDRLYLTEYNDEKDKRIPSACLTLWTENDASGCAETENVASATSPKANHAARRVRVLRHVVIIKYATKT